MRKTIFHLLVAATLAFSVVPASQALASITPSQQRIEIDAALDVLAAEIQDQIDDLQAIVDGLLPGDPQIDILNLQILSLNGRLSVVEMVDANLPYFPDSLLNRIIIRFDLPVSLS